MNLLLVRLGIHPAIIYKGDRSRYLAALRRADDGDFGPLGDFLARAVLDNLYTLRSPNSRGLDPLGDRAPPVGLELAQLCLGRGEAGHR